MKKMTCNQLGGACNLEFKAETFEEMAQLSQVHGKEMYAAQDPQHLEAMAKMGDLMQDPDAMQQWMDQKKADFEEKPEINE